MLSYSDLMRQAEKALRQAAGDSLSSPEVGLVYATSLYTLQNILDQLFTQVEVGDTGQIMSGRISEEEFLEEWERAVKTQQAIISSVAKEQVEAYGGCSPDYWVDFIVALICSSRSIDRFDPDRQAEVVQIMHDVKNLVDSDTKLQMAQDRTSAYQEATRLAAQYELMSASMSETILNTVVTLRAIDHSARSNAYLYSEAELNKAEQLYHDEVQKILKSKDWKELFKSDNVFTRSHFILELMSQLDRASWQSIFQSKDQDSVGPVTVTKSNSDQLKSWLIDVYEAQHRPWEVVWDQVRPAMAQYEGWETAWAVGQTLLVANFWWQSAKYMILAGLGLGATGAGRVAAALGSAKGAVAGLGREEAWIGADRRVAGFTGPEYNQFISWIQKNQLPPPSPSWQADAWKAAMSGLGTAVAGFGLATGGVLSGAAAVFTVLQGLASIKPLWDATFRASVRDDIVRAINRFVESRIGKSYSNRYDLIREAEAQLFPSIDARIIDCANRVAASAKPAYGRPMGHETPQLDVFPTGIVQLDEFWIRYLMSAIRTELEARKDQIASALMSADARLWGRDLKGTSSAVRKDIALSLATDAISEALKEIESSLRTKIGQRTSISELESWRQSLLSDPVSPYSLNGLVTRATNKAKQIGTAAFPIFMMPSGDPLESTSLGQDLRSLLKQHWQAVIRTAAWNSVPLDVPYEEATDFVEELVSNADQIQIDSSGLISGSIPGLPSPSKSGVLLRDRLIEDFLKEEVKPAIEKGLKGKLSWGVGDVCRFEVVYKFADYVSRRIGKWIESSMREYARERKSEYEVP